MRIHKKEIPQLEIKPANSKIQMLRRRPISAAKSKTYIHTRSGTFKICSPTGEGREQALMNLRKMFTKEYTDISPASTTSAQSGIRKSFSPRTNPPGSPICESPKEPQLNVISMERIKIIHVRSRTQIPCYTINAYPLYHSLKTIKKQEQCNNDDLDSIPQLETGNEVKLNKIKRNPSSESILELNSKNPESVSSKCLNFDKKKRIYNRRKWKSEAININYLNDSSDNQTMKYEKEVISIWNNAGAVNGLGVENNNGIKLSQETSNEFKSSQKQFIPKFGSVSSLNCNFSQKPIDLMEKTPQTKRIIGFSQWKQTDSDEETEKSLSLKPIIFKINPKSIPESSGLSESSNTKCENCLITTENRPRSASSYKIDVSISKKVSPFPRNFKKS
ncbi:unnamed protein product [Blepharisma stoltei]|uniref:Uncharacterized protein n=1 Tax=Blepharisma stoltei TaxID=1481888 RepID=A0AAU9J2F6_9CILI|nr:unnamed protein product [Blepharisma stoltei]